MARAKASGTAIQMGSTKISYGYINKESQGSLQVFFYSYGGDFDGFPVVVVTPWWDGADEPVGSIETVTEITKSSFTIISNNASPNYYVNWIAIGPGSAARSGS